MMLGLRLVREGVAHRRFEALHGVALRDVFLHEVQTLVRQGLLAVDEEGVRLTHRGLLLGNRVFAAFLPDVEAPVADAHEM